MNFSARLLGVGGLLFFFLGMPMVCREYLRHNPVTQGELQSLTVLTALLIGGLLGLLKVIERIGEIIYVYRYGQFPVPSGGKEKTSESAEKGGADPSSEFKDDKAEEDYYRTEMEKWAKEIALDRGNTAEEMDKEFKMIWGVLVHHKTHFSFKWKNLFMELAEIESELLKEIDEKSDTEKRKMYNNRKEI